MADVQPLKGLRYTQERVHDLAQVITPPFDVIDKEAQTRYYERNPYNVVRLELGKTQTNDDTLNTVYTRAAATFAEWRLEEVLQQEDKACYYLYQQKFSYGGEEYTRTSLLARVRLEPWEARVVLPHEHTRTKDKQDRLNLLRACSANFSPIMCMYEDPQSRLRRLLKTYTPEPEVAIVDEAGDKHLLQPITDEEQIGLIQDFFAERQIYIADGHHRYTTALAFRDEVLEQRKELDAQDGVNFVMMALIDMDDPGMLVLPTHRLLSDLGPEKLAQLTAEQLKKYFSVQELEAGSSRSTILARLAEAEPAQAAFVLKTAQYTFLLHCNEQGTQQMQASEHTEAWNGLDVAIVQRLLLETVLGITGEDITAGRHIQYTHETEQAFESLEQGTTEAVVLLNGIPFRQVSAVAQADDRMPQKSTYLYPKLVTGLVINPLW